MTALMALSVKRSKTALTTSDELRDEFRDEGRDVDDDAERNEEGIAEPRARRAAPTEEDDDDDQDDEDDIDARTVTEAAFLEREEDDAPGA